MTVNDGITVQATGREEYASAEYRLWLKDGQTTTFWHRPYIWGKLSNQECLLLAADWALRNLHTLIPSYGR